MLKYDSFEEGKNNWFVDEVKFDAALQGKTEAIMSLGNGYMGIRSAAEEDYLSQKRGTFINGTFNRFSENEVSELPNLPDVTAMNFELDGYRFSLEQGEILEYRKRLDLKQALLTRNVVWKSPAGKIFTLSFERFVSLSRKHVLGSSIKISCDQPATLKVYSGINGQITNTGSQHLNEEDMRFFDKEYLQFNTSTTQSKVLISTNTVHCVEGEATSTMSMDRRKIEQILTIQMEKEVTVSKLSVIYTSIDKEVEGKNWDEIKQHAYQELVEVKKLGFEVLKQENSAHWASEVWNRYAISIKSENNFDELAIRFALYHMTVMAPAHDNRMGIAAKGLSGEGYKGHSFWDTEIFLLPFYIYSNPAVARKLMEYRYLGLAGARKKAKENGFRGAMYPWEAAWPSDGEVTPVWGAVDIITGERTKIWSGFIEIHITCDIALAVWQYYLATNDQDYMDHYGYEILFETATFWADRYEWNEKKQHFEINDVVGPDEYKEHVNNNAFTNYMSANNLRLAISNYEVIKANSPELFEQLNNRLNLDEQVLIWKDRLEKIYLPKPNEKMLIPQDDTYLSKTDIDLEKYKKNSKVGSLFDDYNLEQVNNFQVSKQADIMMLFYQLEDQFAPEVKKLNYDYYEPRTLHDSSLSLSTHSILANDLGDYEKAYDLFHRACQIDLGQNMKSSNDGIHSASIGGVWQCVVMGFAGMRMYNGKLRFEPHLPKEWSELTFRVCWKGKQLDVTLTHTAICFSSPTSASISLTVKGAEYEMSDKLEITL